MDWFKIQAELLKEYGELKKLNKTNSYVIEHEGNVYASVTGTWFAVIPADMWVLQLPTLESFTPYMNMLKGAYGDDLQVLEVSNITQKLKGLTGVKLTCEKFECWVNKKYLALFGRASQLKLVTNGKLKLVFVYDAYTNNLIGCIAQLRVK